MLSWSSQENGLDVNLRAFIDDDADVGIVGGRQLIALAPIIHQMT